MLRQWTARRPLVPEAFHLDLGRRGCRSHLGLRLGFGGILFQVGELKLGLFEDRAALGGLVDSASDLRMLPRRCGRGTESRRRINHLTNDRVAVEKPSGCGCAAIKKAVGVILAANGRTGRASAIQLQKNAV
jgi:hypothetical protein